MIDEHMTIEDSMVQMALDVATVATTIMNMNKRIGEDIAEVRGKLAVHSAIWRDHSQRLNALESNESAR